MLHDSCSTYKFCNRKMTLSALLGGSEFCYFVITSPAFENRCSLATDVAGTASRSRARAATLGKRSWCFAHHCKGQQSRSSRSSFRYSSEIMLTYTNCHLQHRMSERERQTDRKQSSTKSREREERERQERSIGVVNGNGSKSA